VAELIAEAAGFSSGSVVTPDIAEHIGKSTSFYPSTERLAGLGFKTSVALPAGIAETVEWVSNHGLE
jgi:nucleoside-diphosphate-sugar epimerase